MERFIPGTEGETWYEHWHRYHFAVPLVRGKRVLDIACGEGYGSALLARDAARVLGIDQATEVIVAARNRYGAIDNLEFREGRCESIPAESASIDVLVSFETIEHIPSPEALIAEAARILAPGGLFLVSTPNKEIYSDQRDYRNPFHVRELYENEFSAMLRCAFRSVSFFGQRVDAYSAIWPLDHDATAAQVLDARNREADRPAKGLAGPMYFLAMCAQDSAVVEASHGMLSVLSDRDHHILTDYAAVQRRLTDMRAQLERTEAAYIACQRQLAQVSAKLTHAHATVAEEPKQPGEWRRR